MGADAVRSARQAVDSLVADAALPAGLAVNSIVTGAVRPAQLAVGSLVNDLQCAGAPSVACVNWGGLRDQLAAARGLASLVEVE